MNLNKLCLEALEIAQARGIKETTFETLKHCAGEVLEATEAYTRFIYSPYGEDLFPDELADIIICVLSICGVENIDIEKAIERKMKINKERADLTK